MSLNEIGLVVLGFIFPISCLVRLYFYVPQIRAVKRSTDATAINVPTWIVWSVHNTLSALYAGFITGDLKLTGFFAISAACTTWIAQEARKKQMITAKVVE